CLTAYIHGTILSQDPSMNVYDLKFVDAKPDDSLPETAKQFKPFKLDAYGYPPPFLLFFILILLFTGNYFSIRAFVGGLSLIFAIFSIFMIAKTLGGIHEKRIYIFTPFLVSTPPMLITIQVGNFHLIAISLCLLIWVYSEKNKFSLSGTLLAIATISKIFPGLLGVLFIIQKQYRIILATIVAAIAICGISYIVFGSKIWHDFIFYHLPHVQTGRALSFMVDGDQNIEFNLSPFGIPFKLAALGIFNFSWNEAKIFGNIFSIFLLGIGIIAGRKKGSPQFRLSTWIALVMFASLRSPFAGAFVILTVSFLLLILVSEVNSIQSIIFFILAYIAFSLPIPVENSKVAIGISFVRILLLYSFLLWIILRKEKAIPY
ncbi:MAG: DUF2029 domain-containing protein, partial [Leptospiraceae bacterium]|nr:DUF2029 domain-containing protein [Leptospiraceae bacterium]